MSAAIPAEVLRCPVHGIPDCSPLLNGCGIPDRLAAAYRDGKREGLREAVALLYTIDATENGIGAAQRELSERADGVLS